MRILLVLIVLFGFSVKPAYAQENPAKQIEEAISSRVHTATTNSGILWDSGIVKVYNANHVNVWTPQIWTPCPAPLQMFSCPERIYFGDFYVNALASYEAEWIACNPVGTDTEKYFCLTSYIRYAAYLNLFLDRFPGTFELKLPKPLPSCLKGLGC